MRTQTNWRSDARHLAGSRVDGRHDSKQLEDVAALAELHQR